MLKVGVVGIGYMGINHARILSSFDECELVAISDIDRAKGERAAKKYRCRYYENYEEMARKEKLDCVSICVPTRMHAKVMRTFANAGVPFLVEKPIAPTAKEAEEVVRECEKLGIFSMVGHIERFNPVVREVQKRAKKLRVFLVDSERVGPLPTRISDVGVVTDLAVHDIDIIRFVTGMEPTGVYAVTGSVSRQEVEDVCEAIINFKGEMSAHLRVNWLTPTKIRQLKVFGREGMYQADYITQDLYFYENKTIDDRIEYGKMLFDVSEGEMHKYVIKKEEPLMVELSHFLACVEGKEKPILSMEDGIKAVRIAEAISESGRTRKEIALEF
ncbi:MAG: Gfo/Idh/MocA family oxidoreductase [Candidatus Micrarchaeota archaeon]|nr:Gfo/Idh/MocA family oxidoreductase [Candidatus Micrarchaeota archaeon]